MKKYTHREIYEFYVYMYTIYFMYTCIHVGMYLHTHKCTPMFIYAYISAYIYTSEIFKNVYSDIINKQSNLLIDPSGLSFT
jgi:hypothetical protein